MASKKTNVVKSVPPKQKISPQAVKAPQQKPLPFLTKATLHSELKKLNVTTRNGSVKATEIPQPNPGVGSREAKTSDMTDRWSQQHNPYLASLRDPLNNPGARIPDGASGFESTTIQVVYHSNITVDNTSKLAGVIIGQPTYSTQTGSNDGPYMVPQSGLTSNLNGLAVAGATHLVTSSASTVSTLFPDSTTGGSGASPQAIPNIASFLNSYATYARVVSAGLSMRTTTNYTKNQGFFIVASLPPVYFGSITTFSTTTLLNAPKAQSIPCVDALGGVSVTYDTLDNRCLSYAPMGITGAVVNTDPKRIQLNPGILCIVAVGQTDNTVILLYDIVINYEVQVLTGNIGFGLRPSMVDPIALAVAQNARADDPLVANGSPFDGGEVQSFKSGLALQHNRHVALEATMAMVQKKMKKVWNAKTKLFDVVVDDEDETPQTIDPSVSAVMHLYASPVRLTRKGKGSAASVKVAEQEEEPMFESLVNTVATIAKGVGTVAKFFL